MYTNALLLILIFKFKITPINKLWRGFQLFVLSADLRDSEGFLSVDLRVSQGFLSADLRVSQGFISLLRVYSLPSVQTSRSLRVSSVLLEPISRSLRVSQCHSRFPHGFLIVIVIVVNPQHLDRTEGYI